MVAAAAITRTETAAAATLAAAAAKAEKAEKAAAKAAGRASGRASERAGEDNGEARKSGLKRAGRALACPLPSAVAMRRGPGWRPRRLGWLCHSPEARQKHKPSKTGS